MRPDPTVQQTLIDAVHAGDTAAAERALHAGANIDLPMVDGGTPPLVLAARRGDRVMVEWLLSHGALASVSEGYAEPQVAYGIALQRGDTETARSIVSKIGYFDRAAYAAAVIALAQGPHDDDDTFHALGRACAEGPGLSLYDFELAFATAAARGHQRLTEALIALGGKPKSVAEAARAGAPTLIRLLASHGASINLPDKDDQTPLHAAVAAERNAAQTVETLLRMGCRHNGKARDHRTPSQLAVALGRPELAQLIDTLAPHCGPRYMQQARARGINRYVFLLTRAFGLGFDPNDLERPILWEGDDAGFGWPLTAAEGLERWERDFKRYPEAFNATRWFIPYMEKLFMNEDFELSDMERSSPWFRTE